jgi:hypothetical protein
MKGRRLNLIGPAVAAVLLAGCSSVSAMHGDSGKTGSPGPSASAAAGAHNGTPGSGSPGQANSSPAGPGALKTTPGGSPVPERPIYSASLANSCVTPGGTQTITIKSTAGYQYAFDTEYGQGQYGSHYGGSGVGFIPAGGTYQSTWVVAAGVTPGDAVVYVSVSDTVSVNQSGQLNFKVQPSC